MEFVSALGAPKAKTARNRGGLTACLGPVVEDLSEQDTGYVPSHLKMHFLSFLYLFGCLCFVNFSELYSLPNRRLEKCKDNLYVGYLVCCESNFPLVLHLF